MNADLPAGVARLSARALAVATLALGAALALRALLDPWLQGTTPFSTLYGAVAVAVWVAGYRAGIASGVLGFMAAQLLFVRPPFALLGDRPRELAAAVAYGTSVGIIVFLGEAARRARRRSAEQERVLQAELAERRGAEAQARALAGELAEQLEEQRTLLEVLPTGVVIGDARGEPVKANEAGEAMIGLPAADGALTPGGQPRLRWLADGRELRPDELPLQRAARWGVALQGLEHDVVRPDGSTRTLSANVRPLLDGEGQVRGVVGAFSDVSELRRQERALREADRRKTELLATLGHELRNPLAAVQHAVDILGLRPPADVTQAYGIAVLRRQVAHIVRLLDDLLDVTRVALGRVTLRREAVPLAEVLRQAVQATAPAFARAEQELSVSLPADAIFVDGDPVRLAMAFGNLLQNAFRFTPRGGHIALVARHADGSALVSVSDDGIGMSREELATAFEMFGQHDPEGQHPETGRAGLTSGLGIGLTLARQLIELHDGQIELRSGGHGQGVEALVRLPLAHPSALAATPPVMVAMPEPAELVRPRRKVLIVDDNVDTATGLATLLTLTGGHETTVAHDGQQALQLMAQTPPDLVLLDLGLPGIDGYEVARRARAESWGRDLRLVAVTGFGQDGDSARAREAGFDEHLTKPVDLATLDGALSRLDD